MHSIGKKEKDVSDVHVENIGVPRIRSWKVKDSAFFPEKVSVFFWFPAFFRNNYGKSPSRKTPKKSGNFFPEKRRNLLSFQVRIADTHITINSCNWRHIVPCKIKIMMKTKGERVQAAHKGTRLACLWNRCCVRLKNKIVSIFFCIIKDNNKWL